MAEVGSRSHPKPDGELQDSKRQEIGRQTQQKRQPKAGTISASECDRAPQTV